MNVRIWLFVALAVTGVADADKSYSSSVPYEDEKIVPVTPEPSRSTAQWTMYRLSLATIGRRVYGWVSIPKGQGPCVRRVGREIKE